MRKINLFISKHAYLIAISLFTIALGINVAACAGSFAHEGFSLFILFLALFEIIFHVLLIYALVKKNQKLTNLSIVLIKTYDAIAYTLLIGIRGDQHIAKQTSLQTFEIINFVSYALAAILLIIILILFCFSTLTKKPKYWKKMEACLVIAILIIFICFICETVNCIMYSSLWYKFLEPLYLSFLLTGMLIVCHYIESK